MMISPEGFYESEIKGKDHDGITKVISRLKREIAMLKRTMEHPDYGTKTIMHPSESTQLLYTRLYLECAKKALAEVGEPYKPTAAEQRVMDFDTNIKNISKITLRIGGFFVDRRTYTIKLDKQLHFWVEDMFTPTPTSDDIAADYPMTKEEFFETFAELHVGEWRKYYSTERFGYVVMDGTQWKLKIEYNNGHKTFTRSGSNAYPYNFRNLTELFGIEEENEDPEQDE